jgi:hypothetical protein
MKFFSFISLVISAVAANAQDVLAGEGRLFRFGFISYLANILCTSATLFVISGQQQHGACETIEENSSEPLVAVSPTNFANGAHCGELVEVFGVLVLTNMLPTSNLPGLQPKGGVPR